LTARNSPHDRKRVNVRKHRKVREERRICPSPRVWHANAKFTLPEARRLLCVSSRHVRRPATVGERTTQDMDEQTFHNKFNELMSKIKELPDSERGRMEELAEETKERRERIQQSVTELQESLDYLRLSVKYLVFDLEATRRENAYLRKLVEQSNRDSNTRNSQNPRSRRNPRKNVEREDDNFLEDDGSSGAD
jgi:hypothetical protein